MPSWISKGGVWEPAEEYAVNPNAPKGQEIYKGPDREAVKILKEEGVDHLGTALPDADMLRLARSLGYDSIDKYLAEMVPGAKERSEAAYKKAKGIVEDHKDVPRIKGTDFEGGGKNTAPGADPKSHRKGGFGEKPEVV